jgi:hypothetical protein
LFEAQQNPKERYHTSEIGIFMNIIENLKVDTEDENNKILNIYNFVMNNS